MASLQQLIEQGVIDHDADYDKDWAGKGGDIAVFSADGSFSAFPLGYFGLLVEHFPDPVPSSGSKDFMRAIQHAEDTELFSDSRSQFPNCMYHGLFDVRPDEPTYASIAAALADLESRFTTLREAVPQMGMMDQIQVRIGRMRHADDKALMNLVFDEGRELSTEICGYILSWCSAVWYIDEPVEYQPVKDAYGELRGALHKGAYTIRVAQRIQDAQLVKKVDVAHAPQERDTVLIASTPEEVQAMAGSKLVNHNLVYSGPDDPSLGTLKQRGWLVIRDDIRGPQAYREWLRRN